MRTKCTDIYERDCVYDTYTYFIGECILFNNARAVEQIYFYSRDSRHPGRYYDDRYTLASCNPFCESLFNGHVIGVRLATREEKLDIISNIKNSHVNNFIVEAAKLDIES